MLHFIDGKKIVTFVDFDCGFTFYLTAPTEVRLINRERKNISRSCENSKCILNSDHQNFLIEEEHTSSNFPSPYRLWEMDPTTLLTLNHTTDGDSMYYQYPQTIAHLPTTCSYPLSSSLRPMGGKVKALPVSFAFFQRNYLVDGRVNETVATAEELSDL